MNKLRQKDLPKYREELLDKQGGLCAVCQQPIEKDPVLDHDHETGHCRGVLHRECNAVEGKLINWLRRFKIDQTRFLEGVLAYWDAEHNQNPIHPKHKTEVEKEILRLKRKVKQVKKLETKKKYQDLIRQLQRKAEVGHKAKIT